MSITGILEYCTFDINNSQAIQSSQNCIVCIKLIEGGWKNIFNILCTTLHYGIFSETISILPRYIFLVLYNGHQYFNIKRWLWGTLCQIAILIVTCFYLQTTFHAICIGDLCKTQPKSIEIFNKVGKNIGRIYCSLFI